jgi:pimeloyl-ACP methyl ester carboxylesterase
MPKIKINTCNYHYEIYGSGNETIVLSHGLLWSGKMFNKQINYFKSKYTVITYDHRGQGLSDATQDGYDMDSLYEDVVELLEFLNLKKVHFGGLSMGGFIAMRLAARRPDLVKSLILMETSAQPEPNTLKYILLNTMVKLFGIKAVVKPVLNIMFGDKFLNDQNRKDELEEWTNELLNNNKSIVRAVSGVIKRKAFEDELININCPTLILVGTQDKATIPEKAEFIHSKIKNSTLIYIEGAGHTACVEEPDKYNKAINDFLSRLNN